MTITIEDSQGRILMEALNMALLKYDDLINDLVRIQDEDDEAYEQASEYIHEREHTSRLHDIVLASIGGTVSPFQLCHDADCGWPNPLNEKECENCGGHLLAPV